MPAHAGRTCPRVPAKIARNRGTCPVFKGSRQAGLGNLPRNRGRLRGAARNRRGEPGVGRIALGPRAGASRRQARIEPSPGHAPPLRDAERLDLAEEPFGRRTVRACRDLLPGPCSGQARWKSWLHWGLFPTVGHLPHTQRGADRSNWPKAPANILDLYGDPRCGRTGTGLASERLPWRIGHGGREAVMAATMVSLTPRGGEDVLRGPLR